MRIGLAALRRVASTSVAVARIDKVMTDLSHGRRIAAADAGRAHHADAGTRTVLQFMQQLFRAQHRRRSARSQTRMVSGAISGSPSFTISKCA